MKVRFMVLVAVALSCIVGYSRTGKDVDDEIKTLNKQIEKLTKELRELKRKPIVKYTETHNRSGNIIKRIGGSVEINKRFECGYSKGVYHEKLWSRKYGWRDSVCTKCKPKYYEWQDYKGKVGDCEKILARIEEINGEIDKLKDEISGLKEERAELVREENAAKREAKANKTASGGSKSGAKATDKIKAAVDDKRLNDGLVGHWKFDGNADDASGNGNAGIVHGATPVEDRSGGDNQAYRFDGKSYIEVPDSQSLHEITQAFTVSAWIKPLQWYNDWIVVLQKGDKRSCQYQFAMAPKEVSSCPFGGFKLGGGELLGLELRRWQHVVFAYDSKKASFYRNGELVGLWQKEGVFTPNGESVWIGYDPYGATEFFIGDMDDVRLYNRALSEQEVKMLYNVESP